MRILLDTHTWLWMVAQPERLSGEARERLADPENELFLSAVSSWEIVLKHSRGRLPLPRPPAEYVPDLMAITRTRPLPVEHAHALQVARLPPHHRDPFDRMLVAQGQVERLPILTADPVFTAYDVELLKA